MVVAEAAETKEAGVLFSFCLMTAVAAILVDAIVELKASLEAAVNDEEMTVIRSWFWIFNVDSSIVFLLSSDSGGNDTDG